MSRSVIACVTVLFPLPFWLKRSLMARLFHQGSSPWWSNLPSFDNDAFTGVAVKSLHSLAGHSGFAIPPPQFLLGVLCGPLVRFREGTQFCRWGQSSLRLSAPVGAKQVGVGAVAPPRPGSRRGHCASRVPTRAATCHPVSWTHRGAIPSGLGTGSRGSIGAL